eukprot:5218089-Alexandrium_andersonii.AAC.1
MPPTPVVSAPLPPPAMPIGTEVPPPPTQGSRIRSESEETVPVGTISAGMQQQQQPRQASLRQQQQQEPVGARDPVSYTHLTLPTICSV